ncbi:MAG: WYL domain-containing protein [Clostridium sp.]
MERFKSNVLIYMYHNLLEGRVLVKKDILNRFDITERTFYRYLKDIQNFLHDPKSGFYLDNLKKHDYKKGYILEYKHNNSLKEMEILAISKVLLESRGFINEEIKGIIDKLLRYCIVEDKTKIHAIIDNEKNKYIEPKHGKSLVESLWTLSSAIQEKKVVCVSYRKIGKSGEISKESTRRELIPMGILFSEYYFYLIAFIKGKNYKNPTIFRVDRMEDIYVTNDLIRESEAKSFEDGEFRKKIHFMQGGEEELVTFKFKGESIEAVLDKVDHISCTKCSDGSGYIIVTNTYRKGIKMWLLSQGDNVEVISPISFREEMHETIISMLNSYK